MHVLDIIQQNIHVHFYISWKYIHKGLISMNLNVT